MIFPTKHNWRIFNEFASEPSKQEIKGNLLNFLKRMCVGGKIFKPKGKSPNAFPTKTGEIKETYSVSSTEEGEKYSGRLR